MMLYIRFSNVSRVSAGVQLLQLVQVRHRGLRPERVPLARQRREHPRLPTAHHTGEDNNKN